jgi:uncharacterized low-complexity protein
MNVKALAAIVGTLSLGALATGCASNKSAEGQATSSEAKPAEGGCKAAGSEAKPNEGGCKASATEAKPAEGSCGQGSCGAKK